MYRIKKYSSSGVFSGQVQSEFPTLAEAKAKLRKIKAEQEAADYTATFLDTDKTDLEVVADWSADAYRYVIIESKLNGDQD